MTESNPFNFEDLFPGFNKPKNEPQKESETNGQYVARLVTEIKYNLEKIFGK